MRYILLKMVLCQRDTQIVIQTYLTPHYIQFQKHYLFKIIISTYYY